MAGFEDIKDKGMMSGRGSDLLRARSERMSNKSVQEIRILERIQQNFTEIDKLGANLSIDFDKKLAEITHLSARTEELKRVVTQIERGRMHGAEKAFHSGLRTTLGGSATSSDIAGATRASGNLGAAINLAQTQSTSYLEDSVARGKAMIYRQTERIRETGANIEGNEGQFSTQIAIRDRLIQQVGQNQAALSAQKRLGLDTSSQYYRAVDISERVRSDQERLGIRAGVAEGSFGNRRQAEEQLNQVSMRLIATFEALDEAMKGGASEAGELAKQFSTVEKEYKKQKTVVDEMKGGGGGGGMSGLQAAGTTMTNMGVILQGAAQIARHVGVTSELAQMQNRIGFAGMVNQRFQNTYDASQGDASALRRVLTDQFGRSMRRGALLGGREDRAALVETTGAGVHAAGTVIDNATSLDSMMNDAKGFAQGGPIGAAATAVTGAVAKSTPDMINAARLGTDYSKQITQADTFIRSAKQQKDLEDTVNQISDFSSQTAMDYTRNLTMSTRGLGVGRPRISSERPSDSTSFMHPTGGVGRITEGFGPRINPVTGRPQFHEGIDIGVPVGTPLMAVGAGRVTAVGHNAVSGNYMRLESGGRSFSYAHMREQSTFGGADVAAGQVLGYSGNTGRSTGPHLHFGARDAGGNWMDPVAALTGGGSTSSASRGDRQSIQDALSDPKTVQQIAYAAGIGIKDLPRVVGAGVSGLGKEFGVGDITRGGQLSQIGYMQSPEQYLHARSIMSGGGGNAENFEQMLKNAVANGMDSSKNIMEMVQATGQLAQRSSQMGINAYGGSSEGLMRGIDALRAGGTSANMAVGAAANAAQAAEGISGGNNLTIGNVVEMAHLRKRFGKATLQQLTSLQNTTSGQARSLEQLYASGKDEQAKQMATQLGVLGVVNNAADARALADEKAAKTVTAVTGFGIDEKMRRSITDKTKSGEPLDPAEQSFINGMGKNLGVSGTAAIAYVTSGKANRGELANAIPGGMVGSGETAIKAGAVGDAKVFADGVANFNKAVGGMEALGSTMLKVAEQLKLAESSGMSKKAADSFSFPVGQLNSSMHELKTAIGQLATSMSHLANKMGVNLGGNVNPMQSKRPGQ
jgi:murein DD-endopeptidase MepM/ murein hydrolase activator NlpD